jgi:predicted heme/steroid binding protein
MKTFTEEELKKYDGSDPDQPLYIGYKGKVYDVTDNPLFIDGMHFEHFAGVDLTDDMEDAPHGDEVMEHIEVIGELKK